MTRRERLERCYHYEEVDRPAVYSRANFPSDDPTYDSLKACFREHTEIKQRWSGVEDTPFPVDSRVEPHSEAFERHIDVVHTPRGDLESSMFVSLKGQPGLEESFLLKDREDAEKYLSLPVPQVVGEVDAFFSAVEGVQDTGIVDTGLGINPAGFVARLFGSERFAMMTLTDRDIVHILCERQMQIIINRLKFLLDHGVGPYFSMEGEEYIVPPLHGPRDFHDFNTKYDKPIIDLIHDARGRIHVHSHGSVKKVMQEFVDMDVDVLHPFEPPPMGDITPAQAKAVARGKMCLEGNIQINRMYEATPEEIRDETAALIEAAFDDHLGLIVCPTASPYIRGAGQKCFPQYKAMIDTVLQWPG